MKKKIVIGGIIGALVLIIVAVNILKSTGALPAFGGGGSASVKVKAIEKSNISSAVSADGVIEEVDKYEAHFDMALKVKKIYVEKNQKVTKGQKIVELDLDSLNSELRQAEIDKGKQELAIRSSELAYNDAKQDYDNKKAMFDSGAVSKNELDKAEKAFKDAEIAVGTQSQSLASTSIKISDAQAKLKKVEDIVISPIDGMVSEMNIVEGGFTSIADPAFRFVNPDKLKVKADVKEFDIKNVAVGQEVKITGDAIDKKEVVTGTVESISPAAKKNKTSSGDETVVEVTVLVTKSIPILKPGLTVTCDIITSVKNDVLAASYEMLKEDKDGNRSIFIVDPKTNIMHEKPVKLGAISGLDVEVLEGVNEGDLAVLNVQASFNDGMKISIIKDEK